MIFESPAILWALPLALLPTLIHLMGKRPRKPTPIPSLMWLNTFKTSERRRQKVRDLIVLALRTLIILSIILGLSRPSFETTTQELVIDNHPGLWNQGSWLKDIIDNLPPGKYNLTTRDGARFEKIVKTNIYPLLRQWPSSIMPLKADSNVILITPAFAKIPPGFNGVIAPIRDSIANSWMVKSRNERGAVQISGNIIPTEWKLELNGKRLIEWEDVSEVTIPIQSLQYDSIYALTMFADSVLADNRAMLSLSKPRDRWLVAPPSEIKLDRYKKNFSCDTLIRYTSKKLWTTLQDPKTLILVGFDFIPQDLMNSSHNVLVFPSSQKANRSDVSGVMPAIEKPFYNDFFIAPSLRYDWPSPSNSLLIDQDLEPLLKCNEGSIAGFYKHNDGIVYRQGFSPLDLDHPYYKALNMWTLRDRRIEWNIQNEIGPDYYLQNQRIVGFQTQAITGTKSIVLNDPMQIGLLLALVFALIALIFVKIF